MAMHVGLLENWGSQVLVVRASSLRIHKPYSDESRLSKAEFETLVADVVHENLEVQMHEVMLYTMSGNVVSVLVQSNDEGTFSVGALRQSIRLQFDMASMDGVGLAFGSDKLEDDDAAICPVDVACEWAPLLTLIRSPDVRQRYELLAKELDETVAEVLEHAAANAAAVPDVQKMCQESQQACHQLRDACLSSETTPPQDGVAMADGTMYVGEWSNEKKHGTGRQTWPDGATYSGNWAAGSPEGYGRLVLPNGNNYEGTFVHANAEGYGVYSFANGTVYTGELLKNQQHGHGVEVYFDGARYEGVYKAGKKDGLGMYLGPDGSSYKGSTSGNLFSGPGVHRWKNGNSYSGEWRQNVKDGQGQLTFGNGRVYKGGHVADKKHGIGCFLWPDSRCYIGEWQEGKQHGRGFFRDCAGQLREGEWVNGVRTVWTSEPFTSLYCHSFRV